MTKDSNKCMISNPVNNGQRTGTVSRRFEAICWLRSMCMLFDIFFVSCSDNSVVNECDNVVTSVFWMYLTGGGKHVFSQCCGTAVCANSHPALT